MASRALIFEGGGGGIAAVASQIGAGLLADNAQWVNRFEVQSSSSSSRYTIAQRRSDMVWGCSCPGWRHYRRCKHVADVLERLSCVATAAASSIAIGSYDKLTAAMLASARTAYLELEPSKRRIAMPAAKMRVLDID